MTEPKQPGFNEFRRMVFRSIIISWVVFFPVQIILHGLWNAYIEEKAFHCTDAIGFGSFWESMEGHQNAGDPTVGDWTWDQIKFVKDLCVVLSLLPIVIIFAIGVDRFLIWRKKTIPQQGPE